MTEWVSPRRYHRPTGVVSSPRPPSAWTESLHHQNRSCISLFQECGNASLHPSLSPSLSLSHSCSEIRLLPPTAESDRDRHQAPLSDDTMRAHTRGAPTVFFISLLWPLLTVAAEEVDPSGGIPFMGGNYEGHPMLYFGRAEVEQLQYAAAGTHRNMAHRIREAGESILERPEAYLPPWSSAEYTARWNEVYGNNLGLFSMFCLLYPHRAGALDLAKDYMERMAAQPSWYISFSICFLLLLNNNTINHNHNNNYYHYYLFILFCGDRGISSRYIMDTHFSHVHFSQREIQGHVSRSLKVAHFH